MKNTITIWKNEKDRSKAKVVQDEKGGLRFEYVPYMHAPDDSWCSFSLWCEVGEKYKYAFEDSSMSTRSLTNRSSMTSGHGWLTS